MGDSLLVSTRVGDAYDGNDAGTAGIGNMHGGDASNDSHASEQSDVLQAFTHTQSCNCILTHREWEGA